MKWKEVGHPVLFMWISPKPSELHHSAHFFTSKEYWVKSLFIIFILSFFIFCCFCEWINLRLSLVQVCCRLFYPRKQKIIVKKKMSIPTELSANLANIWQQLGEKCCHITKDWEQSLPLCWLRVSTGTVSGTRRTEGEEQNTSERRRRFCSVTQPFWFGLMKEAVNRK